MSRDISYRCRRILIPEQSGFSFNINRTLLPSVYKSVHLFHVCNELIVLVRVFGIGIGYNKSSFEDIVEFHFTSVGIHNRTTKLPLLGCSTRSKGVPVIILKIMNLYCVLNWGSCVGEYLRLSWLAECIVVKLGNVFC